MSAEFEDLCDLLTVQKNNGGLFGVPPFLDMRTALVITLTYVRRNRVQMEIAESFRISQSSVSRTISALTPAIAQALAECVPTAEELPADEQFIVDGTLASCWSWADRPELYSGKHKTTGVNLQVVCDLHGRLRWVSDPVAGCRHDSAALDLSAVITPGQSSTWFGDKGYIGKGMITPIKKPKNGDLSDWQKEFNTGIHKIRWMIERTIAHLKTWRILHTDYRRPFHTFTQTISAVIALQFYRKGPE